MRIHHFMPSDLEGLRAIYRAGHLAPDVSGLLWFSPVRTFEGSAHGCVRFSLSADDSRLVSWGEAIAGMGFTARRKLEKAVRRSGGLPSRMRACAHPIPLHDLEFSVLGIDGWTALPFHDRATDAEMEVVARIALADSSPADHHPAEI